MAGMVGDAGASHSFILRVEHHARDAMEQQEIVAAAGHERIRTQGDASARREVERLEMMNDPARRGQEGVNGLTGVLFGCGQGQGKYWEELKRKLDHPSTGGRRKAWGRTVHPA